MSSGLGVCANERRCGGVTRDNTTRTPAYLGAPMGRPWAKEALKKVVFASTELCFRMKIESLNVVLLSYFRLNAQRVSVVGPHRCCHGHGVRRSWCGWRPSRRLVESHCVIYE